MLRIVVIAVMTATMLTGGLTAPTQAGNPDYGRLWAADKVLRDGCHGYRYQYRVRPRTNDWSLETFLRDPRGETIAHNAIDSDSNAKRGHDRFRFCRWSTRPGRFKIRGKLTIYHKAEFPLIEEDTQKVVWIKPGYFRMRRP